MDSKCIGLLEVDVNLEQERKLKANNPKLNEIIKYQEKEIEHLLTKLEAYFLSPKCVFQDKTTYRNVEVEVEDGEWKHPINPQRYSWTIFARVNPKR